MGRTDPTQSGAEVAGERPLSVARRLGRLLPRPVRDELRAWRRRWGPANPAVKRAAARRTLRPGRPGGLTRVQFGCGPANLLDDWWNVDLRPFPGIDEVADATQPWPWGNLDAVYGEHFLEHLPLEGALAFAVAAASSLRPGGILRLSTPGLEHVWLSHFRPQADAPAAVTIAATYRANRAFHGWGHQFLWSRPMLEHLLAGVGFRDLTFHDYGQSDRPELRGLERHPGWEVIEGFPSVWIVEAVATGQRPSITELAAEMESELVRYVRSGH